MFQIGIGAGGPGDCQCCGAVSKDTGTADRVDPLADAWRCELRLNFATNSKGVS